MREGVMNILEDSSIAREYFLGRRTDEGNLGSLGEGVYYL